MREEQAAIGLAALGNRTRLRLYKLLIKAGDDGLNVGELHAHLGVPASTLTHHLTALIRAGLVVQERRGREVISRANYDTMDGLVSYLTAECCVGVKAGEGSNAA